MQKIIRIACLLSVLLIQSELMANTIIVKGYVRDSANNPIANRTVKIYSTDSTNHGCILSHTKVTNPNGYYIDTLTCDGDIRKLSIIVENCDGKKIIHEHIVTPNNFVESNFTICKPLSFHPDIVYCKSAFSYASLATGVKFNSAGCFAPGGDSIISRKWSFGDTSAALTGNRFDPTHAYSKAGIYQVCLTIKTKSGCESKYCSTVVFTPESTNCRVELQVNFEKMSLKKIQFNSHSSILTGDSIVQRIWKFGDGNSLDGNLANPLKEYKNKGDYKVCLRVRTAKGCEKEFCITLIIHDTVPGTIPIPAGCKAKFTYTIKDALIVFNSSGSVGSNPSDSIISRTWYYTDSTTSVSLPGNSITPSYPYTKPGNYLVLLVIKTKNGCESRYEGKVVIEPKPIPTGCKAFFTYSIKDSLVVFNSSGSVGSTPSDSIISRTWYYADNAVSLSLPGNIITPSYPYTKPGKYKVYLVIKTKNGCESKYYTSVEIRPANCNTLVQFNAERISPKKIQFNSTVSNLLQGDSVIERKWKFGDNTQLGGNRKDPVKEFSRMGIYNSCLSIKTLYGCEAQICKNIVVQDSMNTSQYLVDYIKIITINPNPVVTRMVTTVYSRNNNVEADISVYDIYGQGKINVKKMLGQGNNIIEIGTESLYRGPYFLKVSTRNGKDSKAFYKL